MGTSQGPALVVIQVGCLCAYLCVSEYPSLLFNKIQFPDENSQIGYFLKNLDLYNVNNAFLSGMEEDLQMYGNQLVTSTSIYTVGYVIGQIPSNLLLTRVSPRWVIPALEVGWGISTICTSSVKSYQTLYAMRFLVGLFE
jgi:MFS family permease